MPKTDSKLSPSKSINSLAKDALSRHLYLKWKYGAVGFGFEDVDRPVGVNGHHIFKSYDEDLLYVTQELFDDPQRALYPTKFGLGQWTFAPEPEDGDGFGVFDGEISARHKLMRSQLRHGLNKTVDSSHLIQHHERKEWREALMGPTFKGPMNALMLVLLKNIRHVMIRSWYLGDISSYIWTVVERIAIAHRVKGATICSEEMPLSNLEEITYRAIGDDDEENIRALIRFAMFPSVRVLNGRGITSRGHIRRHGMYSVWPLDYPVRTSGVTRIKLSASRCSAKALESLLAGIESLQEFSYHHCSNSDGILYEPQKIVKALTKHAGTSLKKLTLCAMQDFLDDDEKRMQLQFVGSLQQLTSLENIVMDDKLFQRRWLNSRSNIPFVTMKPLVDGLPKSTKTITLLQNLTAERARNLFRDLPKLKEERLPNLQKLSYYSCGGTDYATPITESLRQSLEEVGITVSKTRPPYYDHYDMYECPTEH